VQPMARALSVRTMTSRRRPRPSRTCPLRAA
jgi:hypothetical protein